MPCVNESDEQKIDPSYLGTYEDKINLETDSKDASKSEDKRCADCVVSDKNSSAAALNEESELKRRTEMD